VEHSQEKASDEPQGFGSPFRFGIRSLLVVVLISSIGLAIYVPLKHRHQTIQKLRQREFQIEFRDYDQLNLLQRTLVWLCGKDAACPVELVEAIEMDDPELVHAISELTELKHLCLMFISDPLDYGPLKSLTNLETLSAESTCFEDVAFLGNLQNLKVFEVWEGGFTKGLAAVGDLPNIEHVEIYTWDHLELSNEDFAKICKAKTLKRLDLGQNLSPSSVTDFQCIGGLKNLVQLTGVLNPRNPEHQKFIELLPPNCEVSYFD